jgi:hypothetical protein
MCIAWASAVGAQQQFIDTHDDSDNGLADVSLPAESEAEEIQGTFNGDIGATECEAGY